jgi:hypothetical protein
MMCGYICFAREMPFFLLFFRHFFWILGAIFQKKIDECIFLPFMEKSFPRRIYFPMAFSPGCLE